MVAKMREANAVSPGAVDSLEHATFYRRRGKRLADLLFVCLTAPVGLPLVLLLAVLASLDGGWPFYSQMRLGRNGRIYRMWKLRTMIPHADAALAAYLERDAAARQEWDLKQKLEVDPRITRLGAFLRRTSLDELPQLWNVLIGDMSVTGPRPMLPEQRALYPCTSYFRLRPGITGSWQVSARNQSSFAERAIYDREYESGLSFSSDVRILLATIRVVLACTGR